MRLLRAAARLLLRLLPAPEQPPISAMCRPHRTRWCAYCHPRKTS